APRPRRAGKGRRARSEEETSLSPAVDDERRCPAALSGPALRVGGGGGPFATSLLLGRALALASSSFLATGPPAPPTRSCGILKRSLARPRVEASGAEALEVQGHEAVAQGLEPRHHAGAQRRLGQAPQVRGRDLDARHLAVMP